MRGFASPDYSGFAFIAAGIFNKKIINN